MPLRGITTADVSGGPTLLIYPLPDGDNSDYCYLFVFGSFTARPFINGWTFVFESYGQNPSFCVFESLGFPPNSTGPAAVIQFGRSVIAAAAMVTYYDISVGFDQVSYASSSGASYSINLSVTPSTDFYTVVQVAGWYYANLSPLSVLAPGTPRLTYSSRDNIGIAIADHFVPTGGGSTPYGSQAVWNAAPVPAPIGAVYINLAVPTYPSLAIIDLITLTDAITARGIEVGDTITLGDALSISFVVVDTISFTDTATFTLQVTDAITFTDAVVLSFPPGVVDSISFTDTATLEGIAADYFTLTETLSMSIVETATDLITMSESLVGQPVVTFAAGEYIYDVNGNPVKDMDGNPIMTGDVRIDQIKLTESLSLAVSLAVTDVIAMTDTLALSESALQDFFTMTDDGPIYVLDLNGKRVLDLNGNPISISTRLSLTVELTATDSISLSETLSPTFGVVDTITFADTLTGFQFQVNDAISLTDSASLAIATADYFTATETTSMVVAVSGSDNFAMLEILSMTADYTGVPATDTISFSEVLTFAPSYTLADAVSFADTATLTLATLAPVYDAVGLAESCSVDVVPPAANDAISFREVVSVAVLSGS